MRRHRPSLASVSLAPAALAAVVDALGTREFGNSLLRWLSLVAGGDHCVAYAFDGSRTSMLAAASADGSDLATTNGNRYVGEAFWRRDPTVSAALSMVTSATSLHRIGARQILDPVLRRDFYLRPSVREKVLISGHRFGRTLGLSVFRNVNTGPFAAQDVAALESMSELALSLIARHAGFCEHQGSELSSVPSIEDRLRAWNAGLTPRETQVLARLLHGLTIEGTALDLGVDQETVVTYRKRAFSRLQIGTRQQLLERYLQTH